MSTTPHTRTFEYKDDKSAKFWEVTTDGTAVTVRYGKIGTNGQSQTKVLADAAAAAKHVAKLVAEKTGKGYVESGDNAVAKVASEPVPEATPAAPREKAAPAKKNAVTNPAKDPEASPESLLALLNKDDVTNRLQARHPRAGAELIAQDINTPAELLDGLFGISKTVDEHLAIHPNASPELLLRLANKDAKKIRMFALLNPRFSPDLLSSVRSLTLTDLIYSSASSKMTPSQISEVFELLDFSKARTILKRPDCPENILMWALDNGTDSDRASISKRKYLYEKVREKLLGFGGQLATAASKPRKMVINHRGRIFGDFQKHTEINTYLDVDIASTVPDEIQKIIGGYEYYSRKIFGIDPDPEIRLSNINEIESLRINAKYIEDSYLLIENLPHLKVLELHDDVKKFSVWGLKWLVCRNLPSLEKVVINCKVRWLEFEGVPEFRSACLNGSKELAYLAILGKNNLENLDIAGCKHLREVVFSDPKKYEQLNVSSKIIDVQNKSSDIVKLKDSMTFTEVDKAFEIINEGFKLAVRKNLLKKMDNGLDLCYGRENDPDFRPFSFRVLRPLEPVYTGGTGESYVFDQLSHDYLNGNYGVWSSQGCHSPEDCLKESLETIIGLTVGFKSSTKLLDFFVNLVTRERDGEI